MRLNQPSVFKIFFGILIFSTMTACDGTEDKHELAEVADNNNDKPASSPATTLSSNTESGWSGKWGGVMEDEVNPDGIMKIQEFILHLDIKGSNVTGFMEDQDGSRADVSGKIIFVGKDPFELRFVKDYRNGTTLSWFAEISNSNFSSSGHGYIFGHWRREEDKENDISAGTGGWSMRSIDDTTFRNHQRR